jgi:hypothetical protein
MSHRSLSGLPCRSYPNSRNAAVEASNTAAASAFIIYQEKDERRQGAVANTLKLFRNGAVGFIDWLDAKQASFQ